LARVQGVSFALELAESYVEAGFGSGFGGEVKTDKEVTMPNTLTKRVELRATPDWVERTTTRAAALGMTVSEVLRSGADLFLSAKEQEAK
jgi:hypothetical protein